MEEEKEFEEFINSRPKDYTNVPYEEKAQRHYEIQTYMEKIEDVANERISADLPAIYQEMISNQATAQLSLLRDELEELTLSENPNMLAGNEEEMMALFNEELQQDMKNYEEFQNRRMRPEDYKEDE